MKTFSQSILELSANDKLDRFGHNKPLSGSRLKQLAKAYPSFEDFDLDQWQGYPPPSNSSQITKNEIHNLISLGQNRDQWERDIVTHDKTITQAFKEYLDEHDLEVDLDRIKKIKNESHPILLSLKRYYNRPRPQVLAKKIGLDLSFFPLKTAETPSYPSGHATLGRLVAKLVADEAPLEHRRNILDIGERIGYSRQVAGAHYASDTEFGHRLGDELYRLASTREEPVLSLEEFQKLSEAKTTAAFADLFKRNNHALFLQKIKAGELINIDGNTFPKLSSSDELVKLWPKIKDEDSELKPKAQSLIKLRFGAMNKIPKAENGFSPPSSGKPSGEDWEALIVCAVKKYKKDSSWNSGEEWDRIERFWSDYEVPAMKLGIEFAKAYGTNFKQTGSGTASTAARWKGRNKTPKTDIISGKHKISLKKSGGSQLMSAGADEAISTFEAAMEVVSGPISKGNS